MKTKLALMSMLVLSGDLFAGETAKHYTPHELTNVWEYINYPWTRGQPFFSVGSGAMWGPDQVSLGLGLNIINIAQGFPFFKTNAIAAQLYRADGEIVGPTADGKSLLNAPGFTSTMSFGGMKPDPQVMTYFPWGPNVLEESWIEITIASERYWLEIPYGFDCCPTNPPAPANTNGPPKFIPMKTLTEHDHIVRCVSVHYYLGRTSDGRPLLLLQSNPAGASSYAYLHDFPKAQKDDSLHLSLITENGTVIQGRRVDRLVDDYIQREDAFDLITRGADDLRCWGQIEISVDGETHCVTVPSSLYKYGHGHVGL